MASPAEATNLANRSKDWPGFLRLLEWNEGFAFVVILAPDRRGVRAAHEELGRILGERGLSLTTIVPKSVEEVKRIAETVLYLEVPEKCGAVWVETGDAVDQAEWQAAWRWGAATLNQIRNHIRKKFAVPLVFAGPDWLRLVLRGMSPDLWSVVTLLVRLEPEPMRAEILKGRGAEQPLEIGDAPTPWNEYLASSDVERLRGKAGREPQLARALMRLAEGKSARGQLAEAVRFAEEAVSVLRGAGAVDGLSEALMLQGDLLAAQGLVREARSRVAEALEVLEKQADTEALQAAYSKLGDAELALGQVDTAREWYRKARAHLRLGDLEVVAGRIEAARESFENGLEAARRLVASNPSRRDWQRDLWVSYSKLGDLERGLGKGEAARERYQQALDIAAKIAEREPGRAESLRELAVSLSRMGDLHGDLGQASRAREFYQQALEIGQKVVALEPGRADWLRDLAVTYERMGDLESNSEQSERVRDWYRKAVEISRQMVALEPGRVSWQTDLVVALWRLGELEGALEILERLDRDGRLTNEQRTKWIPALRAAAEKARSAGA